MVDEGSSIFGKASGCILHRNPASGKVKLLPLGRWKGVLQQEDLPVKYISISDHLDMVGVQLTATFSLTRKLNGDKIQETCQECDRAMEGREVYAPHTETIFC